MSWTFFALLHVAIINWGSLVKIGFISETKNYSDDDSSEGASGSNETTWTQSSKNKTCKYVDEDLSFRYLQLHAQKMCETTMCSMCFSYYPTSA